MNFLGDPVRKFWMLFIPYFSVYMFLIIWKSYVYMIAFKHAKRKHVKHFVA